jgi:hypothetical protein
MMFKKLSLALAAAVAVSISPANVAAQLPTALVDLSLYSAYTGLFDAYFAHVNNPNDAFTTKAYNDAYNAYVEGWTGNNNMLITLNPNTNGGFAPYINVSDYLRLQSSYLLFYMAQKEALAAFHSTGDTNSNNAYVNISNAYLYMYFYTADFFILDTEGNFYLYFLYTDPITGIGKLIFFPLFGET